MEKQRCEKKRVAEQKQHKERERRRVEEDRAAKEEAKARQERLRRLSRQRNTQETTEEPAPQDASVGQKHKASVATSVPSTTKTATPRASIAAAASTTATATAAGGSIRPPTFDLRSLNPQRNAILEKLLEADCQKRRPSNTRPEFQRTKNQEVMMRHGFKSGLQALCDCAGSQSLPPFFRPRIQCSKYTYPLYPRFPTTSSSSCEEGGVQCT